MSSVFVRSNINPSFQFLPDTFKDFTGDVIIKLIVRQVYHCFNFKFIEVFRIRVLVFISIYSFNNTFKFSIGEVTMNLIVRQVYHYSNFKFVEVFSVQVKFLVFYKSVNTQIDQF